MTEGGPVLVVKGVNTTAHLLENVTFDLYFMENRLVGIHAFKKYSVEGTAPILGTLLEAGVGVQKAIWEADHGKSLDESLDEQLASDKKNFSVNYTDVNAFELKRSR